MKMLKHSSRSQMRECGVESILLFEHVFWTQEVTRYGTCGYMKYDCVGMCVCSCLFTCTHELGRAEGWQFSWFHF